MYKSSVYTERLFIFTLKLKDVWRSKYNIIRNELYELVQTIIVNLQRSFFFLLSCLRHKNLQFKFWELHYCPNSKSSIFLRKGMNSCWYMVSQTIHRYSSCWWKQWQKKAYSAPTLCSFKYPISFFSFAPSPL